MKRKHVRLSRISSLHYLKLVCRTGILLLAGIFYIESRIENSGAYFRGFEENVWVLAVIWIIYAVEMILRFFPSRLESMGCQKQFAKNYRPTGEAKPQLHSWKRTFAVTAVWLALNGAIGGLYWVGIIDWGILVLVSLVYGVCDMICILFFCPFQKILMKNKCCINCRIYDWGHFMMFTPMLFIKNFYSWSLFFTSLVVLIHWEISYAKHPERFWEGANQMLQCRNCKERTCQIKRKLAGNNLE